jgi:23S rRNA (guanosine2251-2'-O)-methyltransferase
VPNLAQALGALGDLGVIRIGLDGEADARIEEQRLTDATALVLGAEGKGLRRLTRDLCDRLCRIGTAGGGMASLNVSNAAAIALHMAALQRRADK